MTLRVTLEIIPFGVEENKRVIRTINISNISNREPCNNHEYDTYVVEIDEYKQYDDFNLRVFHKREDGAEHLVYKVLDSLGYGGDMEKYV